MRALKFLSGLSVGLVVICGIWLAFIAVSGAFSGPPAALAKMKAFSGAEATRLGAARVEVQLGRDLVREDCRGACDDLRDDSGMVRALVVTDRAGKRLSSSRPEAFKSKWIEGPMGEAGHD
jgi:hypothetical protein